MPDLLGCKKREWKMARLVLLFCLCFFLNSCGIYDRPNFSEGQTVATGQGLRL